MKFEYKIIDRERVTERDFDAMGKDGWELVCVTEIVWDGDTFPTAYFKRRME